MKPVPPITRILTPPDYFSQKSRKHGAAVPVRVQKAKKSPPRPEPGGLGVQAESLRP